MGSMRFEFATAQRIIFGPGTAEELPDLIQTQGRRAFLIHGAGARTRTGSTASLIDDLEALGRFTVCRAVHSEPNIASIEDAARQARDLRCDLVVGIGGGSVLDTAKAAAALAANPGQALDYMEVVGAGRPLEAPALSIIAVPTTAGTGSEVTRNAVIAAPDARAKVSIRHPSMLPRIALVDPSLTHDLPPEVTASSGLDALTQLLEAYVSRRAQPLTDGFCLEGMARVHVAMRQVYFHPEDACAREAMSAASLMSGLALANAGLGAVHGIAGALGGAYPAPHGAACAALLPHVTRINIRALRARDPDSPALARLAVAASVLAGVASATGDPLDRLYDWLLNLTEELRVPRLRSYGLTEDAIPALAHQAVQANSTRGNPIDLQPQELEEAITAAL